MAKTGVKYIDRTILYSPICIGLCLSEENYRAEMKRLKIDEPGLWPVEDKATTWHYYQQGAVKECCIICMQGWGKYDEVEVYGLLIHEAVHIWRKILDNINETNPGTEIEAYGIQNIAQSLIETYRKLTSVEEKAT